MSDLLNNPPRLQAPAKEEKNKDNQGSFLLEKTTATILGKKRSWKYLVENDLGRTEGFARSRRGALLKIKIWSVRRAAQKRREERKDIDFLVLDDFLHLAGENFPAYQYKEGSLQGRRIAERYLLFSGINIRSFSQNKNNWTAGLVRLEEQEANTIRIFAEKERARKRAEKKALLEIKKEISKEELAALAQLSAPLVKKG